MATQGATNRLDMIDSALLRPGRFDELIEVPLPTEAARREIFKHFLAGMPTSPSVDVEKLAKHVRLIVVGAAHSI